MELTQVSDSFLLSRVTSGDAVALQELYRRHEQFLYSFAYHLVGDEGAAAQVLASVFERLWRRGLPRQTDLVGWLLSMVQQEGLATGWQGGGPATPTAAFQSREAANLAELVLPALNSLPVTERQALEQLYFRGADLQQVAPLLGVAVAEVASRLHAPLEHLRDRWAIGVEAEIHEAEPLVRYALGRLEGEPLHSLLSHLRHCTPCRGRAKDYRAVVELLPYSVQPLAVPPDVGGRALAFLPIGSTAARRWQLPTGAQVKRFVPAVALVIALLLGWQVVTLRRGLSQQAAQVAALQSQLTSDQATNTELLRALQAFATTRQQRFARGQVTLTLQPLSTHPWYLLTAEGLPPPMGGQRYQLWLDGRAAGSLSFTESGEAFALVEGPAPQGLTVTLERGPAAADAPKVFEYP